MTIDEIRAIREKTSLKTMGMTTEELQAYFAKGAADIEMRIAEIRMKNSIAINSHSNEPTSRPVRKNEYGFIRGAEYYANLSKANTSMTVRENPEE